MITMLEIERKYLVVSDAFKEAAHKTSYMIQGFLNTDPDRTVRVRLYDNRGSLTIKGRSSEDGTTRFEWETEISTEEAEALLELCEEGMIEKTRYEVAVGDKLFEVDEFMGENEGLTVAEIELTSTDELFVSPDWLGDEVTGEAKYYNSNLAQQPFKKWKDEY